MFIDYFAVNTTSPVSSGSIFIPSNSSAVQYTSATDVVNVNGSPAYESISGTTKYLANGASASIVFSCKFLPNQKSLDY